MVQRISSRRSGSNFDTGRDIFNDSFVANLEAEIGYYRSRDNLFLDFDYLETF